MKRIFTLFRCSHWIFLFVSKWDFIYLLDPELWTMECWKPVWQSPTKQGQLTGSKISWQIHVGWHNVWETKKTRPNIVPGLKTKHQKMQSFVYDTRNDLHVLCSWWRFSQFLLSWRWQYCSCQIRISGLKRSNNVTKKCVNLIRRPGEVTQWVKISQKYIFMGKKEIQPS